MSSVRPTMPPRGFQKEPPARYLQCCVEGCPKNYGQHKQIPTEADLPPPLTMKPDGNMMRWACQVHYQASLAYRKSVAGARPSRECSSSSRPPAATPVAARTASPSVSGPEWFCWGSVGVLLVRRAGSRRGDWTRPPRILPHILPPSLLPPRRPAALGQHGHRDAARDRGSTRPARTSPQPRPQLRHRRPRTRPSRCGA